MCLFTSVVGICGTLLNSRPILAFYNLLLWPCFISILIVGYTSFKRQTLSLDKKLDGAWSQDYNDLGRLKIQNAVSLVEHIGRSLKLLTPLPLDS